MIMIATTAMAHSAGKEPAHHIPFLSGNCAMITTIALVIPASGEPARHILLLSVNCAMMTNSAIGDAANITARTARVLLPRVNGNHARKTLAALVLCHASLGFVLLNRKMKYVDVLTKNAGLF